MIRNVTSADAQAICDIYNPYIERTTVSFETEPLTVVQMSDRIEAISAEYPYLVHETDGQVDGYAYVSRFAERAAYDGTVDFSIYLAPRAHGRGVGRRLTAALLAECRRIDYRTVIAHVVADNAPSMRFHDAVGFQERGRLLGVGRKFGRLLDVVYFQYDLQQGI